MSKKINNNVSNDERIFASISYIFPFQILVLFMAKISGIYSDFIKEHLKRSTILYLALVLINLPVKYLLNLNVTGILFSCTRILIIFLFVMSLLIVLKIFIESMKVLKKD